MRLLAIGLASAIMMISGCASRQVLHPDGSASAVPGAIENLNFVEEARCLPSLRYDNVDVIGDRHLVVRSGNQVWINTLQSRCPGLKTYDAISIEQTATTRLCRSDTVRGVNRMWWQFGPRCTLGSFKRVDPAQRGDVLGRP